MREVVPASGELYLREAGDFSRRVLNGESYRVLELSAKALKGEVETSTWVERIQTSGVGGRPRSRGTEEMVNGFASNQFRAAQNLSSPGATHA